MATYRENLSMRAELAATKRQFSGLEGFPWGPEPGTADKIIEEADKQGVFTRVTSAAVGGR